MWTSFEKSCWLSQLWIYYSIIKIRWGNACKTFRIVLFKKKKNIVNKHWNWPTCNIMIRKTVSDLQDIIPRNQSGFCLFFKYKIAHPWECKLVHSLWKTVQRFHRKLKIELPYDPTIPLLGIYPDKPINQKDTCTPEFVAVLFTIAKPWTRPKCLQMNG